MCDMRNALAVAIYTEKLFRRKNTNHSCAQNCEKKNIEWTREMYAIPSIQLRNWNGVKEKKWSEATAFKDTLHVYYRDFRL